MSSRLLSPDTEADRVVRSILDAEPPRVFTMIAGAGSGKTTSLVKALSHVVASRGPELLAHRQRAACITYTEVAEQEIAEDLAHHPAVHVSTIHSFLWTVIAPFQSDIRTWVQARAERRLNELEQDLAAARKEKRKDDLQRRIKRRREGLPNIAAIERFRYGTASNYGDGTIGHDDILKMVPALILSKPLLTKLLARRFPIVFVDESQDTFPEVVESFRHVAEIEKSHFRLGFFGDPMQKIYAQGVGDIAGGSDWVAVPKRENFRSPERILATINAIRAEGDRLQQETGLPPDKRRKGEVTYFVFPSNGSRDELLKQSLDLLARQSRIGAWRRDRIKILVIAHRMAARRLNFENLYETFHGTSQSEAFDEGHAWPLTPFLGTLLPLVEAADHDRGALMPLLRKNSPLLRREVLDARSVPDALARLSRAVSELQDVVHTGGPGSIAAALRLASEGGLTELDEKLLPFLSAEDSPATVEGAGELDLAIGTYLQGDVTELAGYRKYVARSSPYSTQQGVKGAEYEDVLVVLDDEEGKHFQFSYDKLFGIKGLSPTDQGHLRAGRDSVIDRTRRLLYVCASRATEALAIVFYADDVAAATHGLRASGMPGTDDIVTVEMLASESSA